MIRKDELQVALAITKELLQNKAVSEMNSLELYEAYMSDSGVQEVVYTILESYGLTLIEYKKALYVSPGLDNMLFSYKNEELRLAMNLETNKELYLCYFIMYTIITIFYKETAYVTYKDYITSIEVVDKVTATLEALNHEAQNNQEEKSFTGIKGLWESLSQLSLHAIDENIESLRRSNTQFFFVNRSLHFLVGQGLLLKNELEKTYMPTEKLKALVANYFDHRDVKNALMTYSENLLKRGVH